MSCEQRGPTERRAPDLTSESSDWYLEPASGSPPDQRGVLLFMTGRDAGARDRACTPRPPRKRSAASPAAPEGVKSTAAPSSSTGSRHPLGSVCCHFCVVAVAVFFGLGLLGPRFLHDPQVSLDVSSSLKGKLILLTGGSAGIGRETAKLLAKRGAEGVILITRIRRSAPASPTSIFFRGLPRTSEDF